MVSPVIIGANRVPTMFPGDQPILFVGNHTLYGLVDLPFFVDHFLKERSILMRGLAHPLVFLRDRQSKKAKDNQKEDSFSFEDFGAVQVSPRNFYALMKEKKWVLLFPGGIREAHHRNDEKYKIIWPEEQEFVRTGAKFGALIVPFASVGSDDNFEMLMDGNDLVNIPQVATWLKEKAPVENARSWKQDSNEKRSILPPLSRPRRPSRLYTRFGNPIDLADVDYRDKQRCQDIYQKVRSNVETLIEQQLEARKQDRYGDLARRLAFETLNEAPAPTDLQWSIRGSYIPAEDLPE
uniref:Acyltransferase n=1 Tax=Rhodosorus marinus TaxID=101924 RepID=A0A7S0G920_9RHOD|mmetsp:Transcript_786/g.1178  ORF Transcript_786/g.1178 Transcript_786/m.1178 type:complete len:294 (+) Transcript_786:825-1706(+)